jgi:hypothetical protein
MENKTITMEFDFAPFKKAVTEILLNEVKNHVYSSREDYTKSYDVKGFVNQVWKEIDLEAIRKEVREKIQHTIAQKIISNMQTEIGTDVKAIMSNASIRDDFKYMLRKMTEEILEKIK